jgi:allantoinase
VVFAPEHAEVLDPSTLLHRHPTTPWAGRRLEGRVRETWMRGERIAAEGAPLGAPTGDLVTKREA